MKIDALRVDGFGVWSGLAIDDLSDELNVFYGPNEAGKTTLMQFVRSVLYGFSPERRARYLPPVRPARPGGALRIVADDGHFEVARHADDANDAAVVRDDRHVAHDEHALAALLGQVDEPTFNNVFAVGLREIQELGTLGDTQAADELYSLALGLDRVSLADVLAELEASRNRLLAPTSGLRSSRSSSASGSGSPPKCRSWASRRGATPRFRPRANSSMPTSPSWKPAPRGWKNRLASWHWPGRWRRAGNGGRRSTSSCKRWAVWACCPKGRWRDSSA